MDTLLADIKYGARMLLRRPGFAAVAIVTMALGIGANAAIFSVVNSLLLRPPAYGEPDRIVTVWGTTPDIPREEASLPDFADWREQNTVFSSMAGATLASVNVTGEGDPERVVGAKITHGFLDTMRVAPERGRDITADEDRPNAERVTLLSHSFWERRFGGDPNILGRTVELNGLSFTVVGVMPASFKCPAAPRVDVYVPLAQSVADAGRRSDFLSVFARLRPDVTPEAAETEMKAIMARLAEQYPDSNANWTVFVLPLQDLLVEQSRPVLLILFGAVAFVLLIACANVANLMLARASSRHREIAIRAALGAGRWRIARQVLTESVLLSLVGGAAGLLLAPWVTELLLLALPGSVPDLVDVSVDRWVIAFTFGLATATGALFGLVPALQVSRVGAGEALKDGGRGMAGDARRRLRGMLVASQVGLALVLLVGVGLTVRSFQKLQGVDLGFDPDGVATARITLPSARYGDDSQIVGFYDRLRDRVAGLPGVESVGFANALPIQGGGPFLSFEEQNVPVNPQSSPDANVRVVDAAFFDVMRIPLVAGRKLTSTDVAGTPNVILVNETMTRRYWPGQEPIGRRISFNNDDDGKPVFREIVGVVADVRHDGVAEAEVPAVYTTYAQTPFTSMSIVVRTATSPAAIGDGIRGAVRELDPSLPVYAIRSMDQTLGNALAPRRYAMLLLGLFGGIALVLAAVGIYGVMSYLVAQRTQEIGIRMALGAERGAVLALVLRQGMVMAIGGMAVGGLVAVGVSRFLTSQLYEVSPTDPIAFAVAAGVLVTVALAACLLPARRATKVDPIVALHYE